MEKLSSKSLMIGDWVLDKDVSDKPVQVLQINDKNVHYKHGTGYMSAGVELLEPIPLTTEILEKNGFVVESRYYHGKPLQYCELVDGLWIDISGENYFEGKLEYVHQLQHALRLCGIEKEIIL